MGGDGAGRKIETTRSKNEEIFNKILFVFLYLSIFVYLSIIYNENDFQVRKVFRLGKGSVVVSTASAAADCCSDVY